MSWSLTVHRPQKKWRSHCWRARAVGWTLDESPHRTVSGVGDEVLYYYRARIFKEPKNRFLWINSASLCSLAGRYDNPIPARFLVPIKIVQKFQHSTKLRETSKLLGACRVKFRHHSGSLFSESVYNTGSVKWNILLLFSLENLTLSTLVDFIF